MIEQGTEEWLKQRLGCATASCFKDIMAVSKSTGKPLKAREDYLWRLATERLYGAPSEGFSSRSTDWGKSLEPFARQAYEVETGYVVDTVGFILHPCIEFCGASADGLVNDDGGIEIKCPKDKTMHMKTWYHGMPEEHMPQVQGNLWIHNRKWFDFISYDPRAAPDQRIYIERIERDDFYIEKLEYATLYFLEEVKELIGEIYARKVQRLQREYSTVASKN